MPLSKSMTRQRLSTNGCNAAVAHTSVRLTASESRQFPSRKELSAIDRRLGDRRLAVRSNLKFLNLLKEKVP